MELPLGFPTSLGYAGVLTMAETIEASLDHELEGPHPNMHHYSQQYIFSIRISTDSYPTRLAHSESTIPGITEPSLRFFGSNSTIHRLPEHCIWISMCSVTQLPEDVVAVASDSGLDLQVPASQKYFGVQNGYSRTSSSIASSVAASISF